MLVKKMFAGLFIAVLPMAVGFQVLGAPSETSLADAAMRGDLGAVQSLLNQQVDVDAVKGDGTTGLHWAAYRGDLEMARLLVDAGASVGIKTRVGDLTPLFMASKNGSAELVELLADAGADVNAVNSNGTTPLMLASASGEVDAVNVLLSRGARINDKDITNEQNALMFAAANGRAEVVRLLAAKGAALNENTKVTEILKREYRYRLAEQKTNTREQTRAEGSTRLPTMGGMTALHFAARQGHIEVVRELVDAGADVNRVNAADEMSALTSALLNGGFDIANYLLENGADVNLASGTGVTPLYAVIDAQWAARTWYPAPSVSEERTDYLDLLKVIIDSGADLNARLGKKLWFRTFHGDWIKQDGATAFWRAAKSNDVPAMRILVAAGADPSIPTLQGGSALQAAAGFGMEPQTSNVVPDARLVAVKYLVEEVGADVNGADKQGYTPMHGAALTTNIDVMTYLVAMGADIKARSKQFLGGEVEDIDGGSVGDTIADMANGPKAHNLQYPEVVAWLESLGSENSDHCRAATCVTKTRKEKGRD